MFASLFVYPAVVKRHQEGPLAVERVAYLEGLVGRGVAHATLLRRANYCLAVAEAVERAPRAPTPAPWSAAEVEALAATWARRQVTAGRAAVPRWPHDNFHLVAVEFFGTLGWLRAPPSTPPNPHEARLADFLAAQSERWPSVATRAMGRWQVAAFLAYLDQRGQVLERVQPDDVDAYFHHVRAGWSRASIHTAGKMLRAWFRHAEQRGWARAGLDEALLLPRLYRHEGLPLGPTWEAVGTAISRLAGDDPATLRDRALLLLLATYGLRSGEVRRLQLEDLDWPLARLRVVRSKSQRPEILPLAPEVGAAIAHYLRDGRPTTTLRTVFLTLRAPARPLSLGGLHHIVAHRLAPVARVPRGRGPHGLRHACARRLVDAGHSFKEIGDHLGHRSPDATGIYAKVDLGALRRVAFDDLGGLA
jgi:site-specific recombinase XerD